MRIDPPHASAPLESVCVCWVKDGTDSQIFSNIRVWSADGPSGGPGTLLGTLPTVSASAVSTTTPKFYRYDLSSLGIIAQGPLYIGPEWAPNDDEEFFICMDTNGPVQQPAYGSSSILGAAPTSSLGRVGFFPDYKTLGIRAKFGASVSGCVPSETAMCLANNRFKVEAHYTTPDSNGAAKVVKLTPDTGYFWFFSSSNVEAVVKVLDACAFNQKFWFFAGGLTNVQVVITVTDTQTGVVKTYTNPQATAFKPIQDTGAFSCQ